MSDEIASFNANIFENIKLKTKSGIEYWSARDLYPILEYSSWDKFKGVVEKAEEACNSSGNKVGDHFSHLGKMVDLGSGSKREIEEIYLTRYACYLVVQNGDPSKPVIARGQTYFAIQTRRQELEDESKFALLGEDEKRIALRKELAEHNKQLSGAAKKAGVETGLDYAIFQNFGYKGLYGGLAKDDIHKKKNLKKSQQILDHMGSTELAANLFRATQTEEKLKKEKISGKNSANQTHFEVGQKVRKAIKDIGGAMPEDLPTPQKSIKQIESAKKKARKKLLP